MNTPAAGSPARTDPRFYSIKNILETIVGYPHASGYYGAGKNSGSAVLESVLAGVPRPYLFVALDGLADSENLGGRPELRRIRRAWNSSRRDFRQSVFAACCTNSMGTVFTLPIVYCRNLIETVGLLRTRYGISVLAAHPHTEEHTLFTTDCTRTSVCAWQRRERHFTGVLAACDKAVAVPMHGNVDSLNVASACAVFLYEVSDSGNPRHPPKREARRVTSRPQLHVL